MLANYFLYLYTLFIFFLFLIFFILLLFGNCKFKRDELEFKRAARVLYLLMHQAANGSHNYNVVSNPTYHFETLQGV